MHDISEKIDTSPISLPQTTVTIKDEIWILKCCKGTFKLLTCGCETNRETHAMFKWRNLMPAH